MKVNKKCENCNKQFQVYVSSEKHNKRKFCSRECYREYGHTFVNCKHCGKELKVWRSHSKREFCNRKCRGSFLRKRIVTLCSTCNRKILIQPNQAKKRENHFCSRTCRSRFRSVVKNCKYCKKEGVYMFDLRIQGK